MITLRYVTRKVDAFEELSNFDVIEYELKPSLLLKTIAYPKLDSKSFYLSKMINFNKIVI